MGFVAVLHFDNTRATALLDPGAAPITVGHGKDVRAWLNQHETVVLSCGNLAIIEGPERMQYNSNSGLTLEMLDGSQVTPNDNDLGYHCPQNTDLDLKVNGRCVVRVRSSAAQR